MNLKYVVCFIVSLILTLTNSLSSEMVTEIHRINQAEITVPDGLKSGIVLNTPIDSQIEKIDRVTVRLKINGDDFASNGDYYAAIYLGQTGVPLINHVGKRKTELSGYPDNGFDVTFDDAAIGKDIHSYRLVLNGNQTKPIDPEYTTPLIGTWQPDGRWKSFDTDPIESHLSDLKGLNPSGVWSLVISDSDAGGVGRLVLCEVTITGLAKETITVKPVIQISLKTEGGEKVFHFRVTGAVPKNGYALQGSKDYKNFETLGNFINETEEFEFALREGALGGNTSFRLMSL